MLYEFALEPEILNNWDTFRFFIEQFGVEHGRLIAKFPGNWTRRVVEAVKDLPDVERMRILAMLRQIEIKMYSKGRYFDDRKPWLPNAILQHERDRFHLIISKSNPDSHTEVLPANDVSYVPEQPDKEPDAANKYHRWNVKCEDSVPRTTSALLDACGTLIGISSEIVIVDPQIDLSRGKWRKSLGAVIEFVFNRSAPPRRFEIHTKLKDGFSTFQRETPDELKRLCKLHLPTLIPKDANLRFVAWSAHPSGKNLHGRYLLTERGGFRIDAGFDDGAAGERNDIGTLRHSMYTTCWGDYRCDHEPEEMPSFRLELNLEVTGTAVFEKRR